MNKCKSILGAGTVVVAAAVFCVGCSENSTDPDNGGGAEALVGDWRLVSEEEDGKIEYKPDNENEFYSFTPSGDLVVTYFNKISDFWHESRKDTLGKYTVKGNSLCLRNICSVRYSVSGDTFTLMGTGTSCSSDDGCHKYSYKDTYIRENIANIGTVYSLDPKLISTYWKKTSENGEERLAIFSVSGEYTCIDSVCRVTHEAWYTDGSILVQAVLKCADENIDRENYGCTSWPNDPESVKKYDYQLSDGTLSLRPSGSSADWDVWTQYDPFER